MAQIIVNEGNGPVPHDLAGTLTMGSNPSCHVVLESGSALGCRLELRPLRFGYRAVAVKGELYVNERACEMADLEHGDTLRFGDVMLLYKQPEGDAFAPVDDAGDALELIDEADAGELELLDPADELEELEVLEELPVSEELDLGGGGAVDEGLDDVARRARYKRLEALRRLDLARCGQVPKNLPELSAPGALDVVEALDASGHVDDLEALERDEGLTELTLPQLLEAVAEAQAAALAGEPQGAAPAAEAEALEELEELPELEPVRSSAEAEGLDDALVRARRKRLEALRRVQLARAGEFPELPDLSEAGALDVVAALDTDGERALEAFETDAGLADATPRELLAEVESLRVAAQAPADDEPVAQPEQAAPAADHELQALDELEELDELEALEDPQDEVADDEPVAQPEQAAPAADHELQALDELEELDELEALDTLEELDELEPLELEEAPAADAGLVAAAAAPSAVRAGAPRVSRPVAAPAAPAPVYTAPRPLAPGELPPGARPVPEDGIAFTRPLPAGLKPPAYLPPATPPAPPMPLHGTAQP